MGLGGRRPEHHTRPRPWAPPHPPPPIPPPTTRIPPFRPSGAASVPTRAAPVPGGSGGSRETAPLRLPMGQGHLEGVNVWGGGVIKAFFLTSCVSMSRQQGPTSTPASAGQENYCLRVIILAATPSASTVTHTGISGARAEGSGSYPPAAEQGAVEQGTVEQGAMDPCCHLCPQNGTSTNPNASAPSTFSPQQNHPTPTPELQPLPQ